MCVGRIIERTTKNAQWSRLNIFRSSFTHLSVTLALLALLGGFGCFGKGARATKGSPPPATATRQSSVAENTAKNGFEIPNLSDAFLTGSFYRDWAKQVEGEETRIDNYFMRTTEGNPLNICKASVNGKAFMYEIAGAGSCYAIIDNDGDGIFESKYNGDDLARKKREGLLVPKWVLSSWNQPSATTSAL